MTPIDGVSRALELLRRRLGAPTGKSVSAPAKDGATAAQTPSTAAPEGRVREAIALRLQALDPHEVGFGERATELFVEGVLLAEFDEGLTNEPEFRQLIRAVAREMRAEPTTATELETLLASLRAS